MSGAAKKPLGDAAATVLVVDPDQVCHRFVEMALAKQGVRVDAVRDAAGALETLRTSVIDLVVAETVLPDTEGLRFLRRLGQERRLAQVPFVFWSADNRVATKLSAFAAGAADYLTKPIDPEELSARVGVRIREDRRARSSALSRTYVLAGDFTGLAFADLVSLLHLSRSTGILSIVTPRAAARLFYENGDVVHVTFGNLQGENAFYVLIAEEQGQFEFTPGAIELEASSRTIKDSPTGLLMEGTRLLDTARASGNLDDIRFLGTPDAESQKAEHSNIVPVPTPDLALATQIDAGVRDSFTLGELRLHNHGELQTWTEGSGGQKRLHVFLITELAAGVSAMMAIAGPPSEREVVAGLGTSSKAASVSFQLRRERLFDVLLIDIERPAQFIASLRRAPGLIILAPPSGDFLSVGVESRAELEIMLTRLTPTAMLGVGNASLEAGWAQLATVHDRKIRTQCMRGEIGGAGTELRDVLQKGLRLWAVGDMEGELHSEET